jgi:hypothetical protein
LIICIFVCVKHYTNKSQLKALQPHYSCPRRASCGEVSSFRPQHQLPDHTSQGTKDAPWLWQTNYRAAVLAGQGQRLDVTVLPETPCHFLFLGFQLTLNPNHVFQQGSLTSPCVCLLGGSSPSCIQPACPPPSFHSFIHSLNVY